MKDTLEIVDRKLMVLHDGKAQIERVEIDVEDTFQNEEKMFANIILAKVTARARRGETNDDLVSITIVGIDPTFESVWRDELMLNEVEVSS